MGAKTLASVRVMGAHERCEIYPCRGRLLVVFVDLGWRISLSSNAVYGSKMDGKDVRNMTAAQKAAKALESQGPRRLKNILKKAELCTERMRWALEKFGKPVPDNPANVSREFALLMGRKSAA